MDALYGTEWEYVEASANLLVRATFVEFFAREALSHYKGRYPKSASNFLAVPGSGIARSARQTTQAVSNSLELE
jgi:hypothetical protein